jgi:hypothetical protein
MRTIALAIALLATPFAASHAADPAAADPVGINKLMEKPAEFAGSEITVAGHVDRVSAERRMVVLIDSSEAGCSDGCSRKTLVVQLPEKLEVPAKGSNVRVVGKLSAGTAPKMSATALVLQ